MDSARRASFALSDIIGVVRVANWCCRKTNTREGVVLRAGAGALGFGAKTGTDVITNAICMTDFPDIVQKLLIVKINEFKKREYMPEDCSNSLVQTKPW